MKHARAMISFQCILALGVHVPQSFVACACDTTHRGTCSHASSHACGKTAPVEPREAPMRRCCSGATAGSGHAPLLDEALADRSPSPSARGDHCSARADRSGRCAQAPMAPADDRSVIASPRCVLGMGVSSGLTAATVLAPEPGTSRSPEPLLVDIVATAPVASSTRGRPWLDNLRAPPAPESPPIFLLHATFLI